MRRYLAFAGALVLLVGLPSRARAQAQAQVRAALAEEPDPEPRVERWYGWQIAAVDAPLLAVAVTSIDGGGEASVVAGVGLLVSGPIVHLLHDRGNAAGGSLLARVALPALGALAGASTGRGEHEEGGGHTWAEGALVGGLIGYACALSLDMALAWTDDGAEAPPPAPAASPVVMVGSSSATLGFAGNF